MIHLGDITKISGYTAPIVDIITGGSPCQDLSVAGKRAGLSGERSGLFMEQIRIIKEMREHSARTDNDIRPRYMVWENVPGAFSSNKGEDFRAVLEETARIADKTAAIPRPEGGRWSTSGCILGNGWSIAWRVHDAQFWGVPQRRRRIALVADFGGQSAPEILFERESVSRHIEPSREEGKITARTVEKSLDETDNCRTERNRHREGNFEPIAFHLTQTPVNGDITPCLSEGNSNNGQCMFGVFQPTYCIQGNCIDRSDTAGCNGKSWTEDVSYTLNTIDRPAVVYNSSGNDISGTIDSHYYLGQGARGGKEREFVYDARGNEDGSIAPTITGDHENRITDYTALCIGNGQMCNMSMKPIANSLDTMHDQQAVITAVDFFSAKESDINGALLARCSNNLNSNNVCRVENIVRRLTPLEAERLQGFPDHWTDIGDWTDSKGKKHKDADSPRYKALGNSIALPFWQWLADRICAQYNRETTMASLFDGIGGFPLVFIRTGKCKPIFASEIEEFPIAVTKLRFGEETEITQKAL